VAWFTVVRVGVLVSARGVTRQGGMGLGGSRQCKRVMGGGGRTARGELRRL